MATTKSTLRSAAKRYQATREAFWRAADARDVAIYRAAEDGVSMSEIAILVGITRPAVYNAKVRGELKARSK